MTLGYPSQQQQAQALKQRIQRRRISTLAARAIRKLTETRRAA